MSLSLFYCILLLTLFCCKFCIGGNYAVFGIQFFRLKFGLCKESDILHVCFGAEQFLFPCGVFLTDFRQRMSKLVQPGFY